MRKNLRFIITFVVLMLVSSNVLAATTYEKNVVTMTEVSNDICHIEFGEYGEFTKQKVNIDTTNKTIDISLTVKNNQKEAEEQAGEVVLLVDASASMDRDVTVNGVTTTRRKLVLNSAKNLVDKLFSANKDIKIGVVEFSTSTTISEEGTYADAKTLTTALTNDKSAVTTALDTISKDVMGDRTDIDIGLKTASKLLSTSTNKDAKKYIITLTDGVPNTAEDVQIDLYTEKSADPTKAELTKLQGEGINLISMLIDITDDEISVTGRPADAKFKTYKDVANYVYGTALNPTAGKVYYIDDTKITQTVTDSIYTDLIPTENYNLTDIVIKDYFPKNIIDNFNFSYITKPEIGDVSATVDTSDNSITWTIKELKPQETATFTYRLSLKDTVQSDAVGIDLATNKDVTIDFKENGEPQDQVHNDKCPVVKLDAKPATPQIPQTGSNTWLIVGGLVMISGLVFSFSILNLKRSKIK